ncbi:MAG: CvpA family protein, partial [Eubacteriales bacterium]|nr:CvpA family protein [Eubacteriales bacterium]
AINLGSRKMGSMVDMVSQFEVNDLYTQINYNQKPTRVTPLDYGNFFKWITNRSKGIPAYMKIDMTTQEIELIKLENGGIKYSFSEPFNRNVKRHLRFNYPTYIFDKINFEIDDNGTPYWVCPVRTYSIGLFGGPVINKVVLLNAITGELTEYNVEDVPNWIDTVYSADILISYYNYYGTLKNGYFNSILGQKGCLKTTEGYNYIALDDDVWVYTGVTSVGGDKSNVGFVLMNQRTAETRYYTISGAQETSAMASAQGQVQHLKYVATFPLLLNISNQPTYFMALKDEAGLVKNYAMVNIEKYQIVAIGNSVAECEQNYIKLLEENSIKTKSEPIQTSVSGKIISINEIIIDGNTHFFLKLDSSNEF